MPRARRGTVEYVATKGEVKGHYRVRVTLNDGSRSPWIPLAPGPQRPAREEWATEQAAKYTAQAAKENLTPADFGIVRDGDGAPKGETCAKYFDRWLASRVTSGLRSTKCDAGRWKKWIAPHLAILPIASVTTTDLERVVERRDRDVRASKLAWKTAVHVWGVASKLFDDASRSKNLSLRVRKDNPARDVRGPDRGNTKLRAYLFPSELATLLACERIPARRRRMVAVAVYTGLRAGEMRALAWGDVHEDEGYMVVHQATDAASGENKSTKTGRARKVPIEPALLPLLASLRTADADAVFPSLPHHSEWPWQLREDLREAKINRVGLLEDTPTTAKIDWHDLRHTYGTWRAVRGDELTKISRAMGHSTTAMTEKYINEAETFEGQKFGEPFGPLSTSLLAQDQSEKRVESSANRQRSKEIDQKHRRNVASPEGFEPSLAT